jgi:flagellar hook protein FlgE
MFAGVSGLRAHQTMMDVIGNNIANVNTIGYKSSQVVFEDLLSQMIRGAGQPQGGVGGVNPAQVGLGVRLAGITTSFAQGASQQTGRSTDLSILGDGFFVTNRAGETRYTRLGNFAFDSDGMLVAPDGSIVQGWSAVNGVVDTNLGIGPLRMPLGQVQPPRQTGSLKLGGNLTADTAVNATLTTQITVHDAQGAPTSITFSFTKTAADTWLVKAQVPDPNPANPPIDLYATTDPGPPPTTTPGVTLAFDPISGLPTAPLPAITASLIPGSWAGATPTIAVDLGAVGAPDGLLQFSGANSLAALSQDGAALGSLQSFSISDNGLVSGVFSNGTTQVLGQIALATFNNPAGLQKAGDSAYLATINSGLAQVGMPGANGRGTLSSGTLEMSNVDLAQEFTNLIIAQRGFQANSRVITASDELLQDLVNLKR